MRPYYTYLKIEGVYQGYGEGKYIKLLNPGPGVLGEAIMVLKEPMPVDILVQSCTSAQSIIFSFAAPAYHGAVPLIDVLGPGAFTARAFYKIFNNKMKLIGEAEQELEASIDENLTTAKGLTKIKEVACWDESLCAPYVVEYSPGYAVYLRQMDEETIEGMYGQVIFTKNGSIYTLTRRIYNKKRLSKDMPDEVLIYKIIDLKRSSSGGHHIVKWTAATYYTIAPIS